MRGSLNPVSSDQRPEADVAVGMLADRLQQRGHRLRGRGAAHGAAGRHARGVVEVAELADGLRGSVRRVRGVGPRSCAEHQEPRASHARTKQDQGEQRDADGYQP